MRWMTAIAALAVVGTLGGCKTDQAEEPRGGGGGPVYQADRRPDAFEARRHMAQVLVDASRLNAALVREDWSAATESLEATRGYLRLAAKRGTLDQQTRVIALEGRALAVASAIDRRTPAALAYTGQLIRDLVAYHDAYAWGPARATASRPGGGGGGGAPNVEIAPPPLPDPIIEPIIP